MTAETALDPQDLEWLLVTRQRAGDLEGMVALYEADAVLDPGDGTLVVGRAAIQTFFGELLEAGRVFEYGEQRPALVSGDLALTSTHGHDGVMTAEVARRQSDGTWLWAIDQFSLT